MFKKIITFISLFVFLAVPLFLSVHQVQAKETGLGVLLVQANRSTNWGLDTTAQKTGLAKEGGSTSFPTVLGRLVKPLLAVMGSVFLILIIGAGLMWMTAQGNEDKVAKAKKIINTSVVGLFLVIFAYVIAYFLVNNVFQAQNAEPVKKLQQQNP
jgi:hypothetical protein